MILGLNMTFSFQTIAVTGIEKRLAIDVANLNGGNDEVIEGKPPSEKRTCLISIMALSVRATQ